MATRTRAGCPVTCPEQPESVREAFLRAARKLFAEKGFDGVSVKDLAQATGHNAALINYYFKSKEGLYRECAMPLLGAGFATAQRTLKAPCSRQDFLTRFELFVEDFLVNHLAQQDLCIILKRDSHTDVVKNLYREHFLPLVVHLQVFFRSAKRSKILRADVDPDFAAHMVFGCLFQLLTFDRFMTQMDQKPLLDERHMGSTVRRITNHLLFGFLQQE